MTAVQAKQIEVNVGTFQLHDITVSIPQERITAIVGPNGSGKSTLLKVLTRLLNPDKGAVFVHEKPAKDYKAKEFAQTLSMLPQSKHVLPSLTVRELIAYGRAPYKRLFDRMTTSDEQVIDWAMEVTDTQKHKERMFHTLSGGEQQKVRIAMALAQKTDVLLLDEPTTFLDIAHQLEVMNILQKINEEYKITIVMVLHELQQAATYCQYMIAMKHGKIAVAGSPKSILTAQFLKEVYDLEAKVKFEDDYPMIIPMTNKGRNRRW